jgi:hypothetical protein
MLMWEAAQQKISNGFLLDIGWVKLKGDTLRENPRVNQVELADDQTLRVRHAEYSYLVQRDPVHLVSVVFRGQDKWVQRVRAVMIAGNQPQD